MHHYRLPASREHLLDKGSRGDLGCVAERRRTWGEARRYGDQWPPDSEGLLRHIESRSF